MKLSTMPQAAGWLAGAVLATLLLPAQAADWAALGLFDQGTFYIDRDHIKIGRTIIKLYAHLQLG